ncbi:MAG: methylated-DNA--[protein]-cysteine S-methyltransferase [Solirubrobacteraceae bacterium]
MNVSTDTVAPPTGAAWTVYESPVGPLTLVAGLAGLRRLAFAGPGPALDERDRDPRALARVAEQLDEYFSGSRRRFELELDLAGTPFQLAVWRALLQIPYGETVSYAHVARAIGRVERVRAVGAANGRNPIAIIVPCHRVIGADGSLTGYGGGLERKRALLDLEAGVAGGQPSLFSPLSGR